MMSPPNLSTEQLELWEKNGYLIIPDAISPDTVEGLVRETRKLLDGQLELSPVRTAQLVLTDS